MKSSKLVLHLLHILSFTRSYHLKSSTDQSKLAYITAVVTLYHWGEYKAHSVTKDVSKSFKLKIKIYVNY